MPTILGSTRTEISKLHAAGLSQREISKRLGIGKSTVGDSLRAAPTATRRHFIIPDTQVRKGIALDYIPWVAQAIVDYQPDTVIHIGDHWDNPAFSMHDAKGSLHTEAARYEDDIIAGNLAFEALGAPMFKEMARTGWNPEREFFIGNHEYRVQRALDAEPKMIGVIGMHQMVTNGWRRNDFLVPREIDGITYCHYFQSQMSSFPIGGSIDNRFNKLGCSFTQGHQQGLLYGSRTYPNGKTKHGLVAGSCYLHRERYKGGLSNMHFRGVVILNEVKDGNYCIMPLTLAYLCKKYEGIDLLQYMAKKYKGEDWSHLDT